jgi:hypothetical protein
MFSQNSLNKDTKRPLNVSKHAYMFKYFWTENSYKIYWIEISEIDTINKVIRYILYNEDGTKQKEKYMFLVKYELPLHIDTLDYKFSGGIITEASIGLSIGDKEYIGIDFDFHPMDELIFNPISNKKEKFWFIRAIKKNINAPQITPYVPDEKVGIIIEMIDSVRFNVTIREKYKVVNKYMYKLVCKNKSISYPFNFKYFDRENKRIYLYNEGCYLECLKE